MTINSKAGYYTSKSPSMHLHEWTQREKRPKARYVPRQIEGGLWTCKVRRACTRARVCCLCGRTYVLGVRLAGAGRW